MLMMRPKYFLIINPTAGSGKTKKQYPKIFKLLKKRGIDFDFALTQRKNDAIKLSFYAADKGYGTLVSVGGDGTICEVITGIFLARENKIRPKLAILHTGTSPDFNRYHNIPTKLHGAIRALAAGRTELIDVGKISYCKDADQNINEVAFFVSNVNIGLGPLIAAKANNRYRRYLGDFLGTLVASISSAAFFKGMDLIVKIDGFQVPVKNSLNFTIGKDPYLASGMRVFSDIKCDDGRFYILDIKKENFIKLLFNIPKLYNGDFLSYKGSSLSHAKNIEIAFCKKYPLVEFDGDVRGYLPVRIEVLYRALEIIY